MTKIDFRLVMIQFSFSNKNVVPKFAVRLRQKEKPLEAALRVIRGTGVQVIEPTYHVSVAQLLDGLTLNRYALTDATYQERIGGKTAQERYHAIRFEFTPVKLAMLTEEFDKKWDHAIAGFRRICEDAMWRVRGFDNPYYENGEEVPGQRALSLNMEFREPLVDHQQQPIMVWNRAEDGKKEKIPLKPARCLQINDGNLVL